MAEGVLAQLKVLLGMDISQMKSGLNEAEVRTERTSKKIEKNFHSLGSTFSRLLGPLSETGRQVSVAIDTIGESASVAATSMTAFGTAAAVAAGVATGGLLALTGITLKLFEQIDEQADLAKGLGMTTAEYVKLTGAMKLYGIEQQQIAPGFSQFEKIISGLMRSKAGADAIAQLGLSMEKLRSMSPHQQLLAIADAFSKLPPKVNKTAIAAQLFTATLGAKMIPLLEQGAKGVEKLEGKFNAQAEQSQKLADTTKNLSIAWAGLVSQASAGALTLAVKLHIPNLLVALAHPIMAFQVAIEGVIQVFDKMVSVILSGFARIAAHVPGVSSETLNTLNMEALMMSNNAKAAYLRKELLKAQMEASGETPPSGGGGNGNGNGNQPNKAALFLASLKQQIAEFGKGDVAKGIDKLKELGATQAQMAEGKGLLNQLEFLKQEAEFQKGFEKAQESFGKVLEKLTIPRETLDGWKALGATLDGIVDSMREAGASALGITKNSFVENFKAGAMAGIGNPTAGVPGFRASGFGAMRFNMEKLRESAEKMGETFRSSFTRMIEGGQSFSEMLGNLRNELELFIIKALVFQNIAKAFSGATGFLGVIGSFFGGLGAPGRASGGPVEAGQLYKVGERGPEYFVPGVSGQIVPSTTTNSRSTTLVFAPRMFINTPNADSFRKSQGQILAEGYRQMAAMHARNG